MTLRKEPIAVEESAYTDFRGTALALTIGHKVENLPVLKWELSQIAKKCGCIIEEVSSTKRVITFLLAHSRHTEPERVAQMLTLRAFKMGVTIKSHEISDQTHLIDEDWYDENYRLCDVCGRLMNQGYYCEDPYLYQCDEECRRVTMTDEEYEEAYERDLMYWTEWGDPENMVKKGMLDKSNYWNYQLFDSLGPIIGYFSHGKASFEEAERGLISLREHLKREYRVKIQFDPAETAALKEIKLTDDPEGAPAKAVVSILLPLFEFCFNAVARKYQPQYVRIWFSKTEGVMMGNEKCGDGNSATFLTSRHELLEYIKNAA